MVNVVNKNTIVGAVLFAFLLVYTTVLFFFKDSIASFIQASTNPIVSLIIYYITQPGFVLIIGAAIFIGLRANKITRYTIAGILLAFWSDIVSWPPCVPSTGLTNIPTTNFLCSDTIIIRALSDATGFQAAYYFYYLALPIMLLLLATEIAGLFSIVKFFKGEL